MEYISNYEVTTCHSRGKELNGYEQGDGKLIFTGRIKEELGSFISTIITTILREGLR